VLAAPTIGALLRLLNWKCSFKWITSNMDFSKVMYIKYYDFRNRNNHNYFKISWRVVILYVSNGTCTSSATVSSIVINLAITNTWNGTKWSDSDKQPTVFAGN
jgi:hypothetical protein